MRSHCSPRVCAFVCVCVCAARKGLGKISRIIASQLLGKSPLIVARQRLGRNVTAVKNKHATVEESLDALFFFIVARVVSKESRRVILPRTSC
jgi:hypothetical protein